MFPARRPFHVPLADGRVLDLSGPPLVMGILNVTPDSFAEPLARCSVQAAVEWALQMEADGADVVDVGGESTRPSAPTVSTAEELARVIPVIRALSGRLRLPISVDTTKAVVARAALEEGAALVNDVSGLGHDLGVGRAAAEAGAAMIVMHMRGRPTTMYAEAHYDDLVAEVARELLASVNAAVACGVPLEQVIADPGIGFAKQPIHSYGVLGRLPELAALVGRPLLVGPSRKSFMRAALNDRPAPERDWGTAAAVAAAVFGGAHIVRVHAVAPMVQVVRVAEEVRRHG